MAYGRTVTWQPKFLRSMGYQISEVWGSARAPSARRSSAMTTELFYSLINRAAMGRARFMFYPWFFFFSVVLSVTRPKLLSATLRMTQLMVFIRVKNILQIYEYYTLFSIKKLSLQ